MAPQGQALLIIGIFLLAGLAFQALGKFAHVPRVTLLLLFGVALGPSFLDLLPLMSHAWFPLVGNMALVMVGFLLGGKLTRQAVSQLGKLVVYISIAEVLATALVVTLGLRLLGVSWPVALILGAIAPASAPAATMDVIQETGAQGIFTDTIQMIVAIDDAMGLILFSLILVVADMVLGVASSASLLAHTARELGGALLLGVLVGLPIAKLSGRINPGEPTLLEALGSVFLCGGLAVSLDVSFLLSAMVMGCVVANLATHHDRPFHAIENIEQPFLVVFFILAGASLEISQLSILGYAGVVYMICRTLGLVSGAWLGAWLGGASPRIRKWFGLSLLPQAGVALGMALVVSERYEHLKDMVVPIIIGGTVVFELLGPICTRFALNKVGEVPSPTRT